MIFTVGLQTSIVKGAIWWGIQQFSTEQIPSLGVFRHVVFNFGFDWLQGIDLERFWLGEISGAINCVWKGLIIAVKNRWRIIPRGVAEWERRERDRLLRRTRWSSSAAKVGRSCPDPPMASSSTSAERLESSPFPVPSPTQASFFFYFSLQNLVATDQWLRFGYWSMAWLSRPWSYMCCLFEQRNYAHLTWTLRAFFVSMHGTVAAQTLVIHTIGFNGPHLVDMSEKTLSSFTFLKDSLDFFFFGP